MLITLKDQGFVVKLETMGGELKSYRDSEGKEFIWSSDPDFWGRSSPVLFPSIGNLRDGKTMINDIEYKISKHGFARDMEMECQQEADNKAVFTCQYQEDTLKCYPFRFRLSLSYELKGNSLSITYLVENLDDQEMYYHLGAHPGFMCPLEEGEAFSDYILKFPYKETCDSPVYDLDHNQFDPVHTRRYLDDSDTLRLDYALFDIDALVFPRLKSKSVQLLNPATGKGVQVDYPDFSTVAFWTPANINTPFLCVEPWNGSAIFADEDNHFAHKRDIQTLPPGETKPYHLTIRLLSH